ncbi:MAG: glycosyltransferase family 4 protein [Streptosporangiaceae bacterium]
MRMADRVILLAPSAGLGGGIERYVETLEWAFAAKDRNCERISLGCPGPPSHLRMVAAGRAVLRAHRANVRIVAAHRSLLPAASLLARDARADGITVVCHGNDVWGSRHLARSGLENLLMGRPGVRMVAVSSFTAGALWRAAPAAVLTPGLSGGWFQALVDAAGSYPPAASDRSRAGEDPIRVVTAFRLSQWRDKGLPELMRAVRALERPEIRVTVCGSGAVPDELQRFAGVRPGCTIRPNLPDRELARELAAADLFVLATRTRRGTHPSGEGFGLVLLEAQVAGTAVVGPAFGGSSDAYLDGVTGATPADESAEALTRTLAGLLDDPWRLAQMGKQAAEWARGYFAPELYASRVLARLL